MVDITHQQLKVIYIETGGTTTTTGDHKIHSFNSSNFVVTQVGIWW